MTIMSSLAILITFGNLWAELLIGQYIKLLKEGEQRITLQTKYSQQVPTKSLLTVCKYCMNE